MLSCKKGKRERGKTESQARTDLWRSASAPKQARKDLWRVASAPKGQTSPSPGLPAQRLPWVTGHLPIQPCKG